MRRCSPTTARTRAASALNRCGARQRSSARSVAQMLSIRLAAWQAPRFATDDRETMEAWKGASAGSAAPSEIIDLTDTEAGDRGDGAAEVAALTEIGARGTQCPLSAAA